MILVVDAGNTQIKWGLFDGKAFTLRAHCHLSSLEDLPNYWLDIDRPSQIIISNVAGARAEDAIFQASERWGVRPYLVEARANQCGIQSFYQKPDQLGSDRWVAMIGARALVDGNLVVVVAGTATTVHAVTHDGKFLGGLILPGYELMHRSLGDGASKLSATEGVFAKYPTSTPDAITSGAIRATCAAVDQFCRDFDEEGNKNPKIIVSGGAASKLEPYFRTPTVHVEDLIFSGLVEIAKSDLAD